MVAGIGALADAIGRDAGVNARTHGDYHLGQVLRSAAQRFLIIDFEGEPARPLAARRARSSPLRDVAGMLRSFAYAAATAHDEARGVAWERAARDAFLRGYLTAAHDGQALFPRARENTDRLVALFEVEKVFYELQYELDHRPDWAWIPLRGLSRLAP
jgi:maltose alpha-D-glucosyltransferase/alpha-amylase